MSRGYGAVQRKIAEIMARDPNDAYRVDDLCEEVYCLSKSSTGRFNEVEQYGTVEKKHRVAVIRAGKALARKCPEIGWDSSTLGLSFFHQGSAVSRALARMKGCYGYSEEKSRKELAPGGWWHKHVIEGGLYWQRTQDWIVKQDRKSEEIKTSGDALITIPEDGLRWC
jgi:hypothetical protein